MKVSYETRKVLKRVAITVLIVAAVLLVVGVCWFTWLSRYVKYTRQGAVLDMQLPPVAEGEYRNTEPQPTEPIFYNEGNIAQSVETEFKKVQGYWIDAQFLEKGKDLNEVKKLIQAQPANTAIMLDVKNAYGNFLYSSDISSKRSDAVDIEAMDQLIDYLNKSGMYTIARLPAFRDRDYGFNNVNDGLPDKAYNGGALWADEQGCYWLNPSRQGPITYLVNIITELRDMGFDEVVLTDFDIPVVDRVMFDGDRASVLASAASGIVSSCATDRFAVSFEGNGSWTLPEGRTRLYLKGVEATALDDKAASLNISEPQLRLVFQTDVHDTRFEDYGVLRPLSAAH